MIKISFDRIYFSAVHIENMSELKAFGGSRHVVLLGKRFSVFAMNYIIARGEAEQELFCAKDNMRPMPDGTCSGGIGLMNYGGV